MFSNHSSRTFKSDYINIKIKKLAAKFSRTLSRMDQKEDNKNKNTMQNNIK